MMNTRLFRAVAVLTLGAAATAARPARAQPPAASAGAADANRAHDAYLAKDWGTAESAYSSAIQEGLSSYELAGAAYNLACVRALGGKSASDVAWTLRLAFDVGFEDFDHALVDPDFDRVRAEVTKAVNETRADLATVDRALLSPAFPAMNLHLHTTAGTEVSVAGWKGTPVVIVFFRSSAGAPDRLDTLANLGDLVHVVAIDLDGPEAARAWVAAHHPPYLVSADKIPIHADALPLSILVDAGGRVRALLNGSTTPVAALRHGIFRIAPQPGVYLLSENGFTSPSREIPPAPSPFDPADPAEAASMESFASDVPFQVFQGMHAGEKPAGDEQHKDRPLGTTGPGLPAVRIPAGATWYVLPVAQDEAGLRRALDEVRTRRLPGLSLTMRQVPGDALSRLGQLRFLDLSRTGEGDAGLTWIAGLTNLRVLRLVSAWVGDAGLTSLRGMTELRELDLRENGKIGDAGMEALGGLARLEVLRLDETHLGDAGVAKLAALASLREVGLTSDAVRDVKPLAQLHALERAELAGTSVDDASVAALAGSPSLATLDLSHTKITDASVPALAAMPKLEGLWLAGTQVSGPSLAKLARVRRVVGANGYRVAPNWPPVAGAERLACAKSAVAQTSRGELSPSFLRAAVSFLQNGSVPDGFDADATARVRALASRFQRLDLYRDDDLPILARPPELVPGDLLVYAPTSSPGAIAMVRSWRGADAAGEVTLVEEKNGATTEISDWKLWVGIDPKKPLRDPSNVGVRIRPALFLLRPLEPAKALPPSAAARELFQKAAMQNTFSDDDGAIASLASAIDAGFTDFSKLRESGWKDLHSNRRYQALLAKHGIVSTTADFKAAWQGSPLPVVALVNPDSSWCPPCNKLESALDAAAPRYTTRARIVRVEVVGDGSSADSMEMPFTSSCHEVLPCLVRVKPDGTAAMAKPGFSGNLDADLDELLRAAAGKQP